MKLCWCLILLLSFDLRAQIITTIAGTGSSIFSGENTPAISAGIPDPAGGCFDKFGNYYFADGLGSNRIRKIDGGTGIITTIAGTGVGTFDLDGVAATSASLWGPQDVCLDKFGNLYIADAFNYRIRKITPAGVISTIAGNCIGGYSGENTIADTSKIGFIGGICADTSGNIYIASNTLCRVIKISVSGFMTTVAGNGLTAYIGDGIAATDAQIVPLRIYVDEINSLFIADRYNHRVYKVDASTCILNSVVGNGTPGDSGDGGTASTAQLYTPTGISLDICGNLYVPTIGSIYVSGSGRRIRKVTYSTSPNPRISISPSPNDTVCTGTAVTYTAATIGSSSPTYQWYVNGMLMSASGSSYTYTPITGDSVYCKLIATSLCSSSAVTRVSNSIKMVVNPSTPVSVSISSPATTICAGASLTFTASPIGGGTSPIYQWYKNGSVVSATGSTYTYTPADGDSVRCVVISNAACPMPAMASSSDMHITVLPYVTPSVSIAILPNDTVCSGTAVTVTATTVTGGTSPAYQWKKNGVTVGSGTAIYNYTPSDDDSVRCVLTSSYACITGPATCSSGTIHIDVIPVVTPTVTIAGIAIAAVGSPVTVNATVTGSSAYSIKWFKNNVLFATTSAPTVTYTKAYGDDTITARVIPVGEQCYDSTTAAAHYVFTTAVHDMATVQLLINIYPNPASTSVIVTAPMLIDNIAIANLLGQTLADLPCTAKNKTVDISWLPPGVYVIRINDIYLYKLVKK